MFNANLQWVAGITRFRQKNRREMVVRCLPFVIRKPSQAPHLHAVTPARIEGLSRTEATT